VSRSSTPSARDEDARADGGVGDTPPTVAPPAVRERVREDTDLTPEEKETSLGFTKRDEHARVYTAEAGLARRLLAHPKVRVVGVTVVGEGDNRRELDVQEVDDEAVVGVRCDVPVGALTIGMSVRSSGGHADVVTDRVLREGAGDDGRADE